MDISKLSILILLITITTGLATASQAELTIFPEESSTEINDYTHYEVEVQNVGPVKDVYEMKHNYPGEISIAPNKVELEAGQSRTVNVWFNPRSDRNEGTYNFKVSALSRADGKQYSTGGRVNVIKDYNVAISAEPVKTVCRGETATYEVDVTNTGIQDDEFALSTELGQISRDRVSLGPEETTTVTVTASSSEEVSRNFNVRASSTSVSYASTSQNLEFNTETCYDSNIEVNPESQETAAFTPAEFDVTVTNLGTRQDQFTLSSEEADLSGTATIAPGESESASFRYTPQNLGTQQIQITASGNSQASTTASVEAYNGMDSSVDLGSAETVCRDENASFSPEIENTGEASEEFKLSSNKGSLSQDSVTLEPGESQQVDLAVNAEGLDDGRHTVSVESKVSTFGEPASRSETDLTVENCWDLEMDVIPQIASTGENMSTIYEIQLNNVGTRENTYDLAHNGPRWVQIRPESVTVAAGMRESAYMYAGAPFEEEDGKLEITATAEGTQVERSQTVELVVGEELRDSIFSRRGEITGRFTRSTTDLSKNLADSTSFERGVFAVIVGLLITMIILYREW